MKNRPVLLYLPASQHTPYSSGTFSWPTTHPKANTIGIHIRHHCCHSNGVNLFKPKLSRSAHCTLTMCIAEPQPKQGEFAAEVNGSCALSTCNAACLGKTESNMNAKQGMLTVSLMSRAVKSWSSCPAAPCSGTLLDPSSCEPCAGKAGPGRSLSVACRPLVSSGGCAGCGEAGPGMPSCCGSGLGKAGPGASSPYALRDADPASGCPCCSAQPFSTARGSSSSGCRQGGPGGLLSWISCSVLVVAAAAPSTFCESSAFQSSPRQPWASTFSPCGGGKSAFPRLTRSLLTSCALVFIAGNKLGPGSGSLVSSDLGPFSSGGPGCCKAKFTLSSLLGPALLCTVWSFWPSRAETSSCTHALPKGPTAFLDPPSPTAFAPCH